MRVYVVTPLGHEAQVSASWLGCAKNPYDSSQTHHAIHATEEPYPLKGPSQFTAKGQRMIAALLPRELACMYCDERISKAKVPARYHDARDQWAFGVSGHTVWKKANGQVLREITPGMAWDDHAKFFAEERSPRRRDTYTGQLLKKGHLEIPLRPNANITNADGSSAKPRSFYGWQWVQACHAAGKWLPMWHVALPTSMPWRGLFRGDEVFPTYRYATNGSDQGNGYTTGWSCSDWVDITRATLQPSIFHGQGSPGEWHGFLVNGDLNPA